MVIKACFDDQKDSLNFILDTGSGGISLDSATAAMYAIPSIQSDTIITGIAGIKKVRFSFHNSLHLPGLTLQDLPFHLNDYELLSSVYGEKIDGIIGYTFFSKYIVKINFDSLQVEIFSPGKMLYPAQSTTLRPFFTALPSYKLRVKDNRKVHFDFYMDTGAGLCFLMSDRFARDSAVLLKKRKPRITQAEGIGGKTQMRLTIVKEIKLGPYKFSQVPAYLYKDQENVLAYPYTGGLIGNDLLRRFNLIINYPQQEFNLLPNTHFNDPFDYGYSGFSIYDVKGKIQVEDIVQDSPASIAGFELGDEIIGVDNNLSGDIQQYKNILQEPNKQMKVIIRRKGVLQELTIITDSIL